MNTHSLLHAYTNTRMSKFSQSYTHTHFLMRSFAPNQVCNCDTKPKRTSGSITHFEGVCFTVIPWLSTLDSCRMAADELRVIHVCCPDRGRPNDYKHVQLTNKTHSANLSYVPVRNTQSPFLCLSNTHRDKHNISLFTCFPSHIYLNTFSHTPTLCLSLSHALTHTIDVLTHMSVCIIDE